MALRGWRMMLCLGALLVTLAGLVPVEADEVPPSPLPTVDYGGPIGSLPGVPASVDTVGGPVSAACDDVVRIVSGGRRQDACGAAGNRSSQCFFVDYWAGANTNGTRVIWHPVIHVGCDVKSGESITLYWDYTVTSSMRGQMVSRAGNRSIGATGPRQWAVDPGAIDCIRTEGEIEVFTFEGEARAGSASGRLNERVPCN